MSLADVKVVLLGKEYCGKSSLVDRFLRDRFCGDNRYQSTVGAAYGGKRVSQPGRPDLLLGVWDTAGSERYEAMSRLYYRGAKAAIICYDVTCRDSWHRLEHWVNELLKFEQSCRVYICATKKDLLELSHARAVDYAVTVNYAEMRGAQLFETSSKTGENVEELFKKITKDYWDEYDRSSVGFAKVDGKVKLQKSSRTARACCK